MAVVSGRGGRHARPGWKIPNGIYAKQTAQLKDWLLLFEKEDGLENRELAMEDFYRIWNNPRIKEVQIRGKLKMGGEIYGCHGCHNGDQMITSYITSIKRLTHGEPRANRFPRDIMCATTDTGEVYFFNSDQFHLCAAILFWDMANGNPLEKAEHYYVYPAYKKAEFM